MKKLLVLVVALFMTFTLVGCGTQDLEDQIADLEGQVTTLEAEVLALTPSGEYLPGLYYGLDEDSGYNVTVFVNDNGEIESVVFDAFYTKSEVLTTKQTLQEAYTLSSGVTWAAEADELAAAIVANQGWNDDWSIIPGVDGGHDKFDVADQDVIDDIAGVTIGVEGFKAAWDEAIAQAVVLED